MFFTRYSKQLSGYSRFAEVPYQIRKVLLRIQLLALRLLVQFEERYLLRSALLHNWWLIPLDILGNGVRDGPSLELIWRFAYTLANYNLFYYTHIYLAVAIVF
jgi:hypothetical protein